MPPGHCGHILSWVASSDTRKGDVPYVSVLFWDGGTPSLGEGTLSGGQSFPKFPKATVRNTPTHVKSRCSLCRPAVLGEDAQLSEGTLRGG
jgi:hypothetical protein